MPRRRDAGKRSRNVNRSRPPHHNAGYRSKLSSRQALRGTSPPLETERTTPMRQRSRRKPYRFHFDHLEVRNLLAGSPMAIVQDFDSTGLGQLPKGWGQYDNSPGAGFNVLNL